VLPPPLSVDVDENVAADVVVSSAGNILATDVDADETLQYAIIGGNTGTAFKINSDTGVLSTTGASIDYETQDSYTIDLRVTDAGGLTSTSSITITVEDLNEAPVASNAARSVAENLPRDTPVGAIIPAVDQDAGQTFQWTIDGDGLFGIGNDGGIFLLQPLNFEGDDSYTVTVTVRDQGGLPDSASVTITVIDVNEAPFFLEDDGDGLLDPRSLKENTARGTLIGGRIGADDVDDGTLLTFSLHPDETDFTINANNGQVSLNQASLDFETKNRYPLVITVTDNAKPVGSSALSTQATLAINVIDVNEAPWATWNELDVVFEIEENLVDVVVATFTGDDVDDGTVLSYSFTEDNDQFTLSSAGVLKTKIALDYEDVNSYTFDVTVCDNGIPLEDDGSAAPLCDTDTVTVTVLDVNEPPTIEDATRSIEENSARLAPVGDALPASDPDLGQLLLYSIESGNELGIFNINPCSGQVEVVRPVLNYEATNSYTLTIKVVDNGLPQLSDEGTLTINVIDVNEAPTIQPAALRVQENSPVDASVGGLINGADQDAGDVLSWAITDGNVGGAFKIVAATGDGKQAQVQVAQDILDFERLNVYTLTIVASDDFDPALTATATVVVTIEDVNEAPTVVLNGDREVPENSPAGTSIGASIAATDPDSDDSVTFSITGGDGASLFIIDEETGAMATKTAGTLDFETKNEYSVEITATDTRTPQQTGTATLTVHLVDVNEAPSLAAAPATIEVDENLEAGTSFGALIAGTDVDAGQGLLYSIVAGNDEGKFRIDTIRDGTKGEGQFVVATAGALDFETRTTYNVRIRVTDSGEGELTDEADIIISVQNVNEPPRVLEHSVSVLENAVDGALVGLPVPSDDDDVGDTRTYSITTPDEEVGSDAFVIDGTSGQIAVSATGTPVLDFETNPRLRIVVTVTDAGGLPSSRDIWCQLLNVNESPVLSDMTMSVRARPDELLPLAIGSVSATDVDAPDGTGLVYSLDSQSDAGVFSVAADGVVYAIANPEDGNVITTDRDESNPFTVTVHVQDSAFCCANDDASDPMCCDSPPTLETTATLTITVTDANNEPQLSDPASPLVVSENQPAGTAVGDLGFADIDVRDQTYVFTVRAPDDQVFIISQQNVMDGSNVVDVIPTVETLVPLDYEKKDLYNFVVDVVDSHATNPLGSTLRVEVSVRDLNEAPAIVPDTLTSAAGKPVLSVDEDAVGVSIVGADYEVGRLRFTDPDSLGNRNDAYGNAEFASLSWSIVSEGDMLDIKPAPDDAFGAIVFVTGSGLDFEVTPTLDIEVTVTDAPGLSQTVSGVVKINNMNDQPSNTDRTFTVHETAAVGTSVGAVPGTDDDAGSIPTYRIVDGENMQHFEIDSLTGEISVASEDIDFERQDGYDLTISMTDSFVGEDPTQWTVNATATIVVINDNDITITGFSGAVPHATVGGETVVIHGSDFGPIATAASTEVVVRYGAVDGDEFEATNCRVSGDSNTEITCDDTAPGSGNALRWTVTVGGFTRTSGHDVTTSYKVPTITALSGVVDMATEGGTQVSVTGHDFGPEDEDYDGRIVVSYNTQGRRYVAEDCHFTTEALPTQIITCTTIAGVGSDITWQVTAREQTSDAFGIDTQGGETPSRYRLPTVSLVETDEPLLSTHGRNTIVITGESFGVADKEQAHGLVVEYGPYTAVECEVSRAEPHRKITCLTAPGISTDHEVRVTIGGQQSLSDPSPDVAISYLRPVISEEGGVTGDGAQNAGTKGNQNVVIKGDMFGTRAEVEARGELVVTYGATGTELVARRCFIAVDHVQINCETTEGTGKDHSWLVHIGGQTSPLNAAMTSYANPIISFYTGPGHDQAITQGGQAVEIHGENFGPDWLGNEIQMTYQAKTGPIFTAAGCHIAKNHTLIACETAPGAGKEHKWQALIDGLVSTTPTTNYAPPTITAIDGPGATSASTYGGEQVNIHGTNFGPHSMEDDFFESVTYGPQGFGYTATNCEVVDDTLITCRTAPGVGEDLHWIVRIEGQQNDPAESPTTSYALPNLLTTSTNNGPTDGDFEVELTGENLGLSDSSAEVVVEITGIGNKRIIAYPTEITPGGVTATELVGATERVSQEPDHITFVFPEGRGVGKSMRLIVRPQGTADEEKERKSDPLPFSFDEPTISRVVTREIFASGGPTPDMEVTVHGASFGADPRELEAEEAEEDPTPNTNIHLYARLLDPAGINLIDIIDITVPKDDPSDGPYYYELQSWTHSEIRFVVRNRGEVQITLDSVDTDGVEHTSSTPIKSYNFFSPSISSLLGADNRQPYDVPTDGTYTLVISGRNLWTEGVNVSVTIGGENFGVPCTDVEFGYLNTTGQPASAPTQWVSALLPPWTGQGVPVVVWKVFGGGVPEQGSSPQLVDFAQPAILPLPGGAKFRAHTDGSSYIEVEGSNIGVQGAQLVFGSDYQHVGGYAELHEWDHSTCEQTQTSLRCQVPAGEGAVDQWSSSGTALYTLRARVPRLRCVEPEGGTDSIGFDGCVPEVDPRAEEYLLSPENVVFMTYIEPSIRAASQQLDTAGGVITLWGRDLGARFAIVPSPNVPVITLERADRTPLSCEPLSGNWLGVDESQTDPDMRETMQCTLESGVGAGWEVKIVLAGLTSSITVEVDFAPPVLTPLSFMAANGTTNGGYTVAVDGSNFGSERYSSLVSLEIRDRYDPSVPVESPTITELTHELFEFTMPTGYGYKTFTLMVDGQASNSINFEYNAPYVEDLLPRFINTNGGRDEEMTLVGTSMGNADGIVEIFSPRLEKTFTYTEDGEEIEVTDVQPARWYNCSSAPAVCVQEDGGTVPGCDCKLDRQNHEEFKLWPPPGMGQDLTMRVFVGSGRYAMESNVVGFGYGLPTIDHVIPTPADSEGDDIKIYGSNFGGVASTVIVRLDGIECTEANWVKDKSNRGEPYLKCRSARHTVGGKNVSLGVAFQDTHLSFEDSFMMTECKTNFYGQESELCLACPEGADCAGKDAEPVAKEGWFNLNVSRAEGRCHEDRAHREYCNYLVPCEPNWACTGNNECADGYISVEPTLRCAECDLGYYRLAGECVECPDNPLFLILGFIVGAILACGIGYVLNSKNVNLAFVSIGVDYFQVLAMFRNSRVQWPQLLKDLFHLLSVFNFNLEITAPECSIPDLGYVTKWTFIQSLPLLAGSLMLLLYVTLYLKKRLCGARTDTRGRKRNLHKHAPAMVGTGLVLFYYLYLYLTRTVLDVFNCAPTQPPDGKEYLLVVFEECGLAGGIQMTLLPFALAALLLYVMGYPILVAKLLRKNKMLIMEDQLLRANNKGDDRNTNRNAYDTRKKYSKLYYHFKPNFWYWILVVIGRKFGIAFTGLMFVKNPAFQLSCALLVLFVAYALQVKNQPFMSMSERAEVLEDHKRRAANGDPVHLRLLSTLGANKGREKKKGRRFSWGGSGMVTIDATAASKYIFSYNTVEATLLFCAVLVCLAGVMFESNRFDSEYFATQKLIIVICVMIVIGFSIIYFCSVLFSEIYVTLCKKVTNSKEGRKALRQATGKSVSRSGGVEMLKPGTPSSTGGAVMEGGGAASLNPMFARGESTVEDEAAAKRVLAGGVPNATNWAVIKNQVAKWQSAHDDLKREFAELKRSMQMQRQTSLGGGGFRRAAGGAPKVRKQFGQVQTEESRPRTTTKVKRGKSRRHRSKE